MKALKALRPSEWLKWSLILSGAICGFAWFANAPWLMKLILSGVLGVYFALIALIVLNHTRRTRSDGDTVGLDTQSGTQRSSFNPPGGAEWLVVLIVSKRSSDGMLGDLEERFHRHVETHGLRRARWLYWAEVLRSIAPILWAKTKRLGMIAAIAEIWRRTHS
jgi:hypothetical protein